MNTYSVHVIPAAWEEMKTLPGHMRQRVKGAVDGLEQNPRPPKSKALDVPDVEYELRRLRLDRWRIVYAITEGEKQIDVLTVRKRPPYDYGDLRELIEEM